MVLLTIIDNCVYINVKEQYEVDGNKCVVIGFTICHHCSNAWIATFSIYLVVGPLFISVIYSKTYINNWYIQWKNTRYGNTRYVKNSLLKGVN